MRNYYVSGTTIEVIEEFRGLRYAALAFALALAAHGADHAIRGFSVVTTQISWAGNIQIVGAIIAVALVYLGHRLAPVAAMTMGFASAAGFSAAHLLPTWSAFSDSYVTPAAGAGVTAYSWVTAVLEISTALVFGVVAVRVWRRRALRATTPVVSA